MSVKRRKTDPCGINILFIIAFATIACADAAALLPAVCSCHIGGELMDNDAGKPRQAPADGRSLAGLWLSRHEGTSCLSCPSLFCRNTLSSTVPDKLQSKGVLFMGCGSHGMKVALLWSVSFFFRNTLSSTKLYKL